jgi:hypothetical protein
MRKLIAIVLLASATTAQAYEQPELDALLAPIALYPDGLVNHILVAAAYPDQVSDAARGVPAQPHWHPSVTALLSYPELLQRMAESRQWMHGLSQAYIYQQAMVLQTVQALRARARAPQEPVYVRYYDPLVVYGTWWWPAHRPVFWRPWHHHRVFVPHHHHHHHVTPLRAPSLPLHVKVPESQRHPIVSSTPPRLEQRRTQSSPSLHQKRRR